MLLVLPFGGPAWPDLLASLPGVSCGPVTDTICLPVQMFNAPPSAKGMSVHIEVICTGLPHVQVNTHTHTHTDKRSFTLSTLYYMCKPPTKDVSQIQSTHEWSESTGFPAFWMLDFPTIIVHLIRKRCVLNTLIWMFLNNTWGQTEKHLNENYTGYSLHFWNYSLWIARSRTWPIDHWSVWGCPW